MADNTHVTSTKIDAHIFHLQIKRLEKKNALTRDMYDALTAGLTQAAQDPECRVLLLSGAEGCFTSGNDIKDFMEAPPTGLDSPVFRFLLALVEFPKPIVAAVQGFAVGIGTTMLLHCDLVYAAPSARFQMPFVNLGLCPEAACSLLLPQTMGHQRAAELLMFGDAFNAEKAHQYGIINDIQEDDVLLDYATDRARTLATKPPASLRLTKMLLKQRSDTARIKDVMKTEGAHFIEQLQSPEATEAFTAFVERRKPDFSSFS